jgi:hypothetical protein
MGVSDYKDSKAKTVLLKLETGTDEDYYVNFNRKSGINQDVREGGDQVLVTRQGENGIGYSESKQVARLSLGGSYEIPNFGGLGRSVYIKVNMINTSTSPGYADVSVEMGCTSDWHCERDVIFACTSSCNRNTNTCEVKAACNCDYSCNSLTEDLFQCPSDCLDPQTLETSKANEGVHAGNMFEIQAKREVQITNFEIDVQSEGKYVNAYVYTKIGGYAGFGTIASSWRLIQTTRVKSEGENELTELPKLPNPIVILAGRRHSFYITLESNDMVFTRGQSDGAQFAFDDNIEFFVGAGVTFPFGTGFPRRVFNGRIKYVEVSSVGAVEPIPISTPAKPEEITEKKRKRVRKRQRKKELKGSGRNIFLRNNA